MKTLGPNGIAAFERRNISAETAVRYEIYTANRQADGSVIHAIGPQTRPNHSRATGARL